MPRPLAVLIDLDGTLVDTLELLLSSVRHAFREWPGPAPTEAEWRAGIGTPLARQLAPFARSDAELEALIAGYRGYQGEHHDRLTRLYPGAQEAIDELRRRGHPLAIVTSKGYEVAHRTLRHVGLAADIPVVIGCDSCTAHKPDPEPVRVALAQLDYAPADAVFVGDSPHDVVAGAAAGVTTVGALWGFFDRRELAAAGADHLLDTITALPALVAELDAGRAARLA